MEHHTSTAPNASPPSASPTAHDEASAGLVKSLTARHEEESKRVGFSVPADADVPPADAFASP
jgi:hypothetical protein